MLAQIALQLPALAATVAPLAGEIHESLESVAKMGFRAVVFSATQPGTRPRDLDMGARKDLLVQLRKRGLACAGFDLWIPPAHFIDCAFVDRAVEAVLATVTLAAALGRCTVSISLPVGEGSNAARLNEVRSTLESCGQRAGVRIADHGLDSATGKWSARSEDSLGVGIDPPQLIGAGQDVVALTGERRLAIACARVGDLLTTGMRGPPGERHGARLDFDAYAATLASIPLATSPVADARQWTDPRAGLRLTLERWTRGEQ